MKPSKRLGEGYGELGRRSRRSRAITGELDATHAEQRSMVQQVPDDQERRLQCCRQGYGRRKGLRNAAAQQRKKKSSDMAAVIRKLDTQQMDVPSGEITWVSLPNKVVWINRGRADALQRQTKFTVYSAESTNGAKAVKKGTIEVTRITAITSPRPASLTTSSPIPSWPATRSSPRSGRRASRTISP